MRATTREDCLRNHHCDRIFAMMLSRLRNGFPNAPAREIGDVLVRLFEHDMWPKVALEHHGGESGHGAAAMHDATRTILDEEIDKFLAKEDRR